MLREAPVFFDAKEGVIRTWLVDAVMADRPEDLARSGARRFGLSSTEMDGFLARMVKEDWLTRMPGERKPSYGLGARREIVRVYRQRRGVDVGYIWRTFFWPFFPMTPNVENIARFGFEEVLRNAFEHAQGKMVSVLMRSVDGVLTICVTDDGVGVFEKVRTSFGLEKPEMALLELAKGKLIPEASRRSGDSIYLVAHLFDVFAMRANGMQFVHHSSSQHDRVPEETVFSPGSYGKGTTVVMVIAAGSPRTMGSVMGCRIKGVQHAYTRVPVKLMSPWGEPLLSREQAQRMMSRLEHFGGVVLDFAGVEMIGPDFADEVFRVFASACPAVRLDVKNAAPVIRETIRLAEARREGDGLLS